MSASTASSTDRPAVTAVHLFVRSLSPDVDGGRVEEIVARLDDLAEPIDATVHVWGNAVGLEGPLAKTPSARFVLEEVADFRDWADRNGAELVGFETREANCAFTDRNCRMLCLPTVALAATHGDDLVAVAPVRLDGDLVTVDDLLSAVIPARKPLPAR
ncbi:HTH domain-containing protein [Haloglomus litoreum]|uniref:HTH domain-containing protein n=1 Tax=Haloglomus litoreum TaxID=3034026 RepID=UPI0023E89AFF|nr:HTH domain-containing protein [Haloglomus sp. DT116]